MHINDDLPFKGAIRTWDVKALFPPFEGKCSITQDGNYSQKGEMNIRSKDTIIKTQMVKVRSEGNWLILLF